ncbi:hypothetical protein ACFQO1_04685 [Jejudonia soesokkakensis]|uniref:2-dehydro-3-deoxyphosphooctonate aldolase n=1 Tax=Jejudonia soesokkakensis TaxID=1323432 RepID=A0ABW2MQ07_9FLAO
MKNLFLLFLGCCMFSSCGSKKETLTTINREANRSTVNIDPFFDITENAPDDTYGLIGENPVKVGGQSPSNQRRYLASLAGPEGEIVSFNRKGSCCAYKSENGFNGSALVDVYEVTYEGLKKPINIYISFYDLETLYIPKGFTKRM